MCLDLDLENFTTIYTSKFFKKKEDMDDKAKRKLLDEVINGLGEKHDLVNSDEWDLKMVDVNRYYDMMLGFANANTANNMNTTGYITVETHSFGELIIPCGPLVPHGLINHKRYFVRVAISPGTPIIRILEEMQKTFVVKETEIPSLKIGEKDLPI